MRAAAWRRAAVVVAAVVAADQLTKALVRASLDRGERNEVMFGIDLVNGRNSGVAFGFLQDGGAVVVLVTAVALVALLAYFALRAARPWLWLPTGLLLGGALGNIVDRVRDGAVTDFIDFPFWPAFNVADVSITTGVLAMALILEGGRE